MTNTVKPCPSSTPSWFTGHWKDWHRGHGCDQDDSKPRSGAAITEIAQHAANKDSGYLTDAELSFLRGATTSGDTLRVRALAELTTRRADAGPAKFCAALDTWAGLMIKAKADRSVDETGQFERSWREVRLAITKSCLLDRMLNHGEPPSQTPCPVHKGIWIGCHVGWPGQLWSDGRSMDVEPMLQEWHDAGCRCHLHRCGCTTGWNPDAHCGCLKEPPQ